VRRQLVRAFKTDNTFRVAIWDKFVRPDARVSLGIVDQTGVAMRLMRVTMDALDVWGAATVAIWIHTELVLAARAADRRPCEKDGSIILISDTPKLGARNKSDLNVYGLTEKDFGLFGFCILDHENDKDVLKWGLWSKLECWGGHPKFLSVYVYTVTYSLVRSFKGIKHGKWDRKLESQVTVWSRHWIERFARGRNYNDWR